jgi:ATP-binding cassette subfamily B protein
MHPVFSLVMIGWFCVHITIALYFATECTKRSKIHSESRSVITGKIVDMFTNIVAVKSFARQGFEMKNLELFQQSEQDNHSLVFRLMFKMRLIQAIGVFTMMGVGLTWLEIHFWQEGLITAGDVTYIFYTSWSLIIMAWITGIELPNFFKEVGICNQALKLIERQHDVIDVEDAKEIKITKGVIKFENVTFNYRRGNNIFENKNVTINSKQKVGLVGFSGSGKTTFVNLMLRFFDIESGTIKIDEQDISKVRHESLCSQISLIPQDPTLFHRSIMDNIRYGNIDATNEDVVRVAKLAQCHEFIEQMPLAYDSPVGERGVKLSGGQRQRIAIARAILKNAPILILDEATSALDSVTEKHIQAGLKILMQGRTTIVIAHRLSTLSEMDRILVFDKGHIIEDGSHAELLKQNGHYAYMWNMQSGGFLPEIG